MTKKPTQTISLITLVLVFLGACAPAISTPVAPITVRVSTQEAGSTQVASRVADVQTVEIQLMNTTPIQTNVLVRGILTESCASLGESQVQYVAHTFQVTVYTN